MSQAALSEQEAHAIGVDAYLYFYPMVSFDLTRKQSTNIEAGKSRPPSTLEKSLKSKAQE